MKFCKILVIALALMFVCMGAAFAETATPSEPSVEITDTPSARALDMQVKISGKIYDFACTMDELAAQGITICADELAIDRWLDAHNGRAYFQVLLSATKGDETTPAVCGVKIRADGNQTFELPGGLTIGSTKEEVIAALGAPGTDSGNLAFFNFSRRKVEFRCYFDENAEGMPLKEIQMISYAPLSWGFDFDGQAGVQQENLPDPTTMGFDEYIIDGKLYKGDITLAQLEENGWVLDHSQDLEAQIDPQADSLVVINKTMVLFNGVSTMQVLPYNPSDDTACALKDCSVLYLGANVADMLEITLADGIAIGSPYADAAALFGEAKSAEENAEDGYTYYEHKVIGNVTYGFSVYADGNISYLRIRP